MSQSKTKEFPNSESLAIAHSRVERRKGELDAALAEYVLACKTLAVVIDRIERPNEVPTKPNNEKP